MQKATNGKEQWPAALTPFRMGWVDEFAMDQFGKFGGDLHVFLSLLPFK